MTKDVLSTANSSKQIDELGEDIIVVGPGQILSEARKKISLTQQQVADRLNFRLNLVTDIEKDIFDHSLPATFNRGYLRNYAKLVTVDIDEVIAAYDLLGVAKTQRSEMQSFSNLTEKQAEHSRLMWLSYFIAAILLGLMVVWWFQQSAEDEPVIRVANESDVTKTIVTEPAKMSIAKNSLDGEKAKGKKIQRVENVMPGLTNKVNSATTFVESSVQVKQQKSQPDEASISSAVFTFSGDCWVNIYDATGERIAWGVKKSGYVMTISGKAPFKVTLGKPELAAIVFNGQTINMSPFNVGNIAKFTLPLTLD
ncbi:MAG: DUF4115 domain-containing protein [Litorilituus sp.]|jgi:cytoskeleton protein RodZ|nr:DUF4115 domain-containing protein [Litorilituus sp.]